MDESLSKRAKYNIFKKSDETPNRKEKSREELSVQNNCIISN